MKPNRKKAIRIHVSDLTEVLKPYPSGWVALTSDEREVVAAAPTVEEAHAAALRKGCPHPLLVPVIPPDRGFVGQSR